MDKLSKLQALLGDQKVGSEDASNWDYISHPKPKHLYEGTDSEDDEIITSRGAAKVQANISEPVDPPKRAAPSKEVAPNEFEEYQLEVGQLAVEAESFCPFQTIKKYPYVYVGNANRQKVSEGFFDRGKLYERTWDFFYLYRSEEVDASQAALILVPTRQFEHFLRTINSTLGTNLTIPGGGANGGFQVTFETDGTPRPRYLGRATDKDMAESLRNAAPPSYYKLDGESDATGTPSERSLTAFKAKIDLMFQAQKGKKLANKEKQKTDRIAKQQSWNHSIKRVQRYLGIREASHTKETQMAAIRKGLETSGLEWMNYDAAVKAAAAKLPPSTTFHPDKPPAYEPEGSVVFVCVDVEAYERNNTQITEIGIATLDTEDLKLLTPGKDGTNWMGAIRARHFRINEYRHLKNTEFVDGCADRFEFGSSEFINLKDAPQVVASCFKHPFSNPDEKPPSHDLPKRNIILVGHDVRADINYLRQVGYDVYNLSNLQETVDTAAMWRYVKRDTNPRNLGSILAELDIFGWNLHNAGNDAVYTLQAMVKIAVKDLKDRQKLKESKEKEMKERVAESIKDATMAPWEREQGWSSGGENSDGGQPIRPIPPINPPKTGLSSQSLSRAKMSTPWRPRNQGPSNHAPSRNTTWGAPAAGERTNASSASGWDVGYHKSGSWAGPDTSRRSDYTAMENSRPKQDDAKLAALMQKTKFEHPKNDTSERQNGWAEDLIQMD